MTSAPVPDLDPFRERLVQSLVATVPLLLGDCRGEGLYGLALTTDNDVVTVRLLAETEERLGRSDAFGDEDNRRWWPDEWGIADDDVVLPGGLETTAQLSDALRDLSDECHGDDIDLWRDDAWDMLVEALGDPRVLAAVTALDPGWRPVLFVVDTGYNGARTVASLDDLNPGHPRPELVAAARAWYAEDD